jgi:hypothetical protein
VESIFCSNHESTAVTFDFRKGEEQKGRSEDGGKKGGSHSIMHTAAMNPCLGFLLALVIVAAGSWTQYLKDNLYIYDNSAHPSTSRVLEHASYFAVNETWTRHVQRTTEKDWNKDIPDLTHQSMIEAYLKLDISDPNTETKCTWMSNILHTHKLPSNTRSWGLVINPARTGLWDENGEFDPVVFAALSKRSIKPLVGAESVITLSAMLKFQGQMGQSNRYLLATILHWIVPVSWQQVTEESVRTLFKFFGKWNHIVVDYVMTLDEIKEFYQDPRAVMDRRSDGANKMKYLTPR